MSSAVLLLLVVELVCVELGLRGLARAAAGEAGRDARGAPTAVRRAGRAATAAVPPTHTADANATQEVQHVQVGAAAGIQAPGARSGLQRRDQAPVVTVAQARTWWREEREERLCQGHVKGYVKACEGCV